MTISALSNSGSVSGATPSADERLQKMFARLDGDGDGKVTQEEFASAMEKRFGASETSTERPDAASIFTQSDTDEDGAITYAEFKTAMAEMRSRGTSAEGAGEPPPGPPPGGGGGPGGAGGAEAAAAKVFDERDTDEDGEVSVDELLAWMQTQETQRATETGSTEASTEASSEVVQAFSAALEAADADGDGSVTQEELASAFKELESYLRGPAPERTGYGADGESTYASARGVKFSAVG